MKRGDRYLYRDFETTPSVEIISVMLPGNPDYDGGLPGIGFKWLKRRGNPKRFFYPCKTEAELFRHALFSNLVPYQAEAKR